MSAHAGDLGVANSFNVFIFNNMKSHGSDAQGRVAVGHDSNISSYSVGLLESNSNGTRDDLIVGHNSSFSNGTIENGNLRYGNSSTGSSQTLPHGSVLQGNPIDFTAAYNDLNGKSSYWSTLGTTGTVDINIFNHGITCTGTDANLNVFNITRDQLAAMNNAFAISAPSSSTVLINVLTPVGQSHDIFIPNTGMNFSGVNESKVVFNMFSASTLTFQGSPRGALLAPNADAFFSTGALEGTLIAQNLNQGLGDFQDSGQFNRHIFGGNLPNSPVPEPASFATLGLGIVAVLRRRKK